MRPLASALIRTVVLRRKPQPRVSTFKARGHTFRAAVGYFFYFLESVTVESHMF